MGGWIKLHRELIEKPIWQCSSPEHKSILITILMLANHDTKEWIWNGKKYKCLPGQFITSLESLSIKSGTSIKNVRTALKNFEEIYEFLANKSTNKNRLITVNNWELYQSKDDEVASKTAENWQASGKQVATNKNDKNDKEINKRSKVDFLSLIESYTEDLELRKTIEDFMEHRKVLKKPFKTIKALELTLKELDKHSDKIGVLNQSIMNGWQGIFEIKQKNNKSYNDGKVPQYANFEQREFNEDEYDKFYSTEVKS